MRLNSERLLLRNFYKKDIADYWEYATHPDVGPRAGWAPYTDKQKAIERLAYETQKPLQFAIVLKSENKLIGSIELMEVKADRISGLNISLDNAKEIGIILNPKYWGRGYVTEAIDCVLNMAFNKLNVSKVIAGYYEPNIGSRRVQEKNGFTLVGRVPDYIEWYQSGKLVDLVVMQITKEQYFERQKNK